MIGALKFVTEADGRHDMRVTRKHACDINFQEIGDADLLLLEVLQDVMMPVLI